jgi:hypothetical protein
MTFVAVCVQAPVASAAPDAQTEIRPGRTCVASLTGSSVMLPSVGSAVADFRCFGSFSEAISHATGGRVQLEPGARRVSREEITRANAEAAATSPSTTSASAATPKPAGAVLGIEYVNRNYEGDALVLSASSGPGCYSGTSYGFPNMALYDFDNRISSAEMFSNCIGKHHQGASYTGMHFYCDEARCPEMGDMNDRTSSIKFY